MLSAKYQISGIDIAPVRITWTQELVDDEDEGCFYVRLKPHVEWADDLAQDKTYKEADGTVHHYKSFTPGTVSRSQAGKLGGARRNEIARQGRKIFDDLKKKWTADAQMKLRAESNKRRGQRWNKKG